MIDEITFQQLKELVGHEEAANFRVLKCQLSEEFLEETADELTNYLRAMLLAWPNAVSSILSGSSYLDRFVIDGERKVVTVVGIIDEPAALGIAPTVYVPLEGYYHTTVETQRGTTDRAFGSLVVAAEDVEDTAAVRDRVIAYFEGDADAAALKQDNHEINVQTVDDAIEQVTDIIGQLTIFIGGIAAIALVVGSIGIANIMIVSVTERTRNIGIMKAIGARQRDIMQLFLVESIILGILGSIFGVLLGLGVGFVGVRLIGWPMAYPLDWIAIAVVVGVLVGIVSGLYPAHRAAKIDPIEALRYE